MDLQTLLSKLNPDDVSKATAYAAVTYSSMVWLPNQGKQTEAFMSLADEIFYGGEAGGGKSDLGVGLALTEHINSLIVRRVRDDAKSLYKRCMEVLEDRECKYSSNGQDLDVHFDGRHIEFRGCQYEEDKQRFKGKPHDLIVFDEVTDFLESQYIFITIWNRTANPEQRCRILATGNPPTTAEGLWVCKRWAAWLDPTHPNPAKEGELRWYTNNEAGDEIEVDGVGPHLIGGKWEEAKSRTFIRAGLKDNPYLLNTNYSARLNALPEHLRQAYRDGVFKISLEDDLSQVIPTAWVRAAMDRWTPEPPANVPMCAIGVDVAQGGKDKTVLAMRYDNWFSPLIVETGEKTPTGAEVAALIFTKRRDGAVVVVDVGGGFGGATIEHLAANSIKAVAYSGAGEAYGRTSDRSLGFYNKRAESYWRLREALDPSQPLGSTLMLPDDPELMADLTSIRIDTDITTRGLKLESKKNLIKRIGRSPDKGDAVVMAWSAGNKALRRGIIGASSVTARPQVILGHQSARRK